MYGADADELEQIASELERYEEELGQLLREGVGAVSLLGLSATLNSIWMGPRASEFAGLWQSRHLLRIRDVQSLLSQAASDLRKNAQEQRVASSGLPESVWPVPGNEPRWLDWFPGIGGIRTPWINDWPHNQPWFPERLPLFPTSPPFLPEGWYTALPHPIDLWRSMKDFESFRSKIFDLSDLAIDGGDYVDDVFLHPTRWFRGNPLTRNVFEWSDELGTFGNYASRAGTVIGAVGLTTDIAVLTDSLIDDGVTWTNAGRTIDVIWSGAGMAYPPVGWTKAAWDTGTAIGDWTFENTPTGEYLMSAHPASDHIRRAELLNSEAPALLEAGRFEEAHQINREAMDAAANAREESEGAKGLLNAAKTTFTFGLF